jgi:hypothetical protein
MQTTIAQPIYLVISGNAALGSDAATIGWPDARVFTFCHRVAFVSIVERAGPPGKRPYAPNPNAWLARMHAEGTQQLQIHHLCGDTARLPDRAGVAFVGGGGRWVIEALKDNRSDLWEATWQVTHRDDPSRRIWTVTYGRIARAIEPLAIPRADPQALQAALKASLEAIAAFARAERLAIFAAAFERSLEVLESEHPDMGASFRDLPQLSTVPLVSRQLLGAVEAGWVFGGMGSWNDLGFEEITQATYDRLSEALFAGINAALVVAANSTAPHRSE